MEHSTQYLSNFQILCIETNSKNYQSCYNLQPIPKIQYYVSELLLTLVIYFVTGTYGILYVMDLNSLMHYKKPQHAGIV